MLKIYAKLRFDPASMTEWDGQPLMYFLYFLQLGSFSLWPGFCFCQVLIQVLSGVCAVGWQVSALGINILESTFRFLAEDLLLSTLFLLPSPSGLGADISPLPFRSADPKKGPALTLPREKKKTWGLFLLRSPWKNVTWGEAEFRSNINRVAYPRISSQSKSCSAVKSPKYQ